VCANLAIRRVGRLTSPEGILAVVEKDLRLFRNSGGGVTFTGGEPLLYAGFLGPIMRRLHDWCVSVAIETCGFWEWAEAAECLQLCDLIFFDVKALEDEVHQRFTGRSNKLILSSLQKLAQTHAEHVIVSIPVIPGVLDSADSIGQVGAYVRDLGLTRVRLLPYHQLGRGKYEALGLPYPHERWEAAVARSAMEDIVRRLSELGLKATVEGWD
jgi:pyruvate formate lyase activating enzyme